MTTRQKYEIRCKDLEDRSRKEYWSDLQYYKRWQELYRFFYPNGERLTTGGTR